MTTPAGQDAELEAEPPPAHAAARRSFLPAPRRIQITGVMLVILAMLAAELAALGLALNPGSATLWWLNLELFGGINAAFSFLNGRLALDYHLTIPALLGLIALSILVYHRRWRFALAVMSNAAFVWCGFSAFLWHNFYAPLRTAGISDLLAHNFEGWILMAYVVAASLLGFLVTHIVYWQAGLRALRRALVRAG